MYSRIERIIALAQPDPDSFVIAVAESDRIIDEDDSAHIWAAMKRFMEKCECQTSWNTILKTRNAVVVFQMLLACIEDDEELNLSVGCPTVPEQVLAVRIVRLATEKVDGNQQSHFNECISHRRNRMDRLLGTALLRAS